jgi:hypothetical protein
MSRKQEKAIRPRENISRKILPEKNGGAGFRVVLTIGMIEKGYHAESDSFVFPVERGTVYLAYEIAHKTLMHCTNKAIGQYSIKGTD